MSGYFIGNLPLPVFLGQSAHSPHPSGFHGSSLPYPSSIIISMPSKVALSVEVHAQKLLLASECLPSLSSLHATSTIFCVKKEATLGRNGAHPYMEIY